MIYIKDAERSVNWLGAGAETLKLDVMIRIEEDIDYPTSNSMDILLTELLHERFGITSRDLEELDFKELLPEKFI